MADPSVSILVPSTKPSSTGQEMNESLSVTNSNCCKIRYGRCQLTIRHLVIAPDTLSTQIGESINLVVRIDGIDVFVIDTDTDLARKILDPECRPRYDIKATDTSLGTPSHRRPARKLPACLTYRQLLSSSVAPRRHLPSGFPIVWHHYSASSKSYARRATKRLPLARQSRSREKSANILGRSAVWNHPAAFTRIDIISRDLVVHAPHDNQPLCNNRCRQYLC